MSHRRSFTACSLPAPVLTTALLATGCSTIGPETSSPQERLNAGLQSCQAQYANLQEADEHIAGMLAALRSDVITLADELAAQREVSRAQDAQLAAPVAEPAAAPAIQTPEKLVVGRREKVWVEALQLALTGRVDTGAETSSLDARNITPFERDGKSWVRFDIPHPDGGDDLSLERPKVRDALIVQANSEEPDRRTVVRLGVQIGSIRQLAEFTLSDRGHLDYQMLVGRNILRDVMLVDVSGTNLVPLPQRVSEVAGDSNE